MSDIQRALGSRESAELLITELYVDLRRKVNAWAHVTKQTAQARMGYIGQHLVSVVTGYEGSKSGARGDDLRVPMPDGTVRPAEIKTCYRIDQLGKCRKCKAALAAMETRCSCGAEDVKYKEDSKWLIGLKNEAKLLESVSVLKYYFVLFDFEDITKRDIVVAQIWEVDPTVPGFFLRLFDYYLEIRSRSSSTAPLDIWPYDFKFALMRPRLIYKARVIEDRVVTDVFPGDGGERTHRLRLRDLRKARSLTDLMLSALAIELELIDAGHGLKKHGLVERFDDAIDSGRISGDALCDTLARAIYLPRIQTSETNISDATRKRLSDYITSLE